MALISLLSTAHNGTGMLVFFFYGPGDMHGHLHPIPGQAWIERSGMTCVSVRLTEQITMQAYSCAGPSPCCTDNGRGVQARGVQAHLLMCLCAWALGKIRCRGVKSQEH